MNRLAGAALALVLLSGVAAAAPTIKNFPALTGGGGGGAVSSVSQGSGCVTVSPTTGPVIVTSTGCLAADFSNVTSPSGARTALGLGTLATQSGTFSGTSSGTNTGDQTITLTGAVTGSGTGSFATTFGGKSGGQTVIGGSATTESLTLRPNSADLITGQLNFLGVPGQKTAFLYNSNGAGNMPQLVMGLAAPTFTTTMIENYQSINANIYGLYSQNNNAGPFAGVSDVLSNGTSVLNIKMHGPGFTTVGNLTAGSLLFALNGGTGNLVYRVSQASGDVVWEMTTSNTERLRLSNAGVLALGTGMLVANGTGTVTVGSLAPGSTALVVKEWMNVKGSSGADRWIALMGP